MERLLEIARKHADAVTVYDESETHDQVEFQNGRLKTVDSGMSSGVALTVVKDGKQGLAYTRNLNDREGLVRDAVAALAGGVEAASDLPLPVKLPKLDAAVEPTGGNAVLAEECRRITDYLSSRVKGQVNLLSNRSTNDVRVLTSSGVDARTRWTRYYAVVRVLYPGSFSGILRVIFAKACAPFPEAELEFIADTYNASLNEARGVPGRRTRALFLPVAVYALASRLIEGTNARNVFEKVSPLAGRIGEQILSEKLTLTDTPLDDSLPKARAFDDEGTPCRDLMLFERGVLKGFYNNRFYAHKTGNEPTGHGYREDIRSRPVPSLENLAMAPGKESFAGLLKLMGRGIVVGDVMGAYSGNILQGGYSMGLAPGLWVEDGAIVGRVKDAMIAGNVYEDLKNVVAVGDTVHGSAMGRYPALLLDGVSLTTRR